MISFLKALCIILYFSYNVTANMTINSDKNVSDVATALSEIIKGLHPRQLAILMDPQMMSYSSSHQDNDEKFLCKHVDDFIYQLHAQNIKSVIFNNVSQFFEFVDTSLHGSIENVNLIFDKPYELSSRIHEQRLAHRLSLFIFYWGAKYPPRANEVNFAEPIRAIVITRPRRKAFRIYYNQATPDGNSNLRLVNWYDGDNLGLQHLPLLPTAANVYSNFNGRVFRVPVFHSPPWFWVNYANETFDNATSMDDMTGRNNFNMLMFNDEEVNVTGGRDHRLLALLAEHMNFQFVYVDAPGRTQGSLRQDTELNESFTGGIGLLQNGLADLLLGDISLSWERRKAVEFSFFTLADSGAFATHSPRRLNEALAILRPFKIDVWAYLIITIFFSGPIFYAIISIPKRWTNKSQSHLRKHDVEYLGETNFYMVYIKEITRHYHLKGKPVQRKTNTSNDEIPNQLLSRCIWFIVQLFLKQSCKELHNSIHTKFLMIVYWIAATYVLADVYSAQLTSQFARPAHEAPINTLARLQKAMIEDGYRLYVEKGSSSLEMLENGTEIFRNLIALMKQQTYLEENGYLIDSVEAGVQLIADGLENKAVFGGRETLYFNIQQFGSKAFQLSQKLYTRYSAVAVQIGCPFLDSLNDVLIHLFEGGIIDKMTTAEYEAQSRMIGKEVNEQQKAAEEEKSSSSSNIVIKSSNDENPNNNDSNGRSAEAAEIQQKSQENTIIQPLNLRMLQGAFIVLLFGNGSAALILILEVYNYHGMCHKLSRFAKCSRNCWRMTKRKYSSIKRYILNQILGL